MKLSCIEGEYAIFHSPTGMDRTQIRKMFNEWYQWCHETFGHNWGLAKIDFSDGETHLTFYFKRLYHAQWFMMKFND